MLSDREPGAVTVSPKRGLPERRRMRHDRHFVDELTHRMGEGFGRMIPVDRISSNVDQPRQHVGDLADLISSISAHGILEPLLVRRRGGGAYELVSGERRFHAAVAAGLTEVPCVELEISDQAALEIALIENLQRRDLSAFEEAEGFQTLIRKYGYTHEQVADAVGKSRVTVTESLKLLDMPEQIRDECRHADIDAKGMLLEIAKAPTEDAMRNLLREIVEEKIDRARLRERRRQLEEETPPVDDDHDSTPPARRKPYVVRFKVPEREFTVSLSFRTEAEPETTDVIQALEDLLRELREDQTETD